MKKEYLTLNFDGSSDDYMERLRRLNKHINSSFHNIRRKIVKKDNVINQSEPPPLVPIAATASTHVDCYKPTKVFFKICAR